MNPAFNTVIAASDAERRDLFLGASARLGTAVQNVEKDFWVCWTLDALFNGLDASGPRLLFKGGTSLSKAFNLISRFSEDIDITVFRDDLGQGAGVADLDALSGKKRRARLEAIRHACQAYVAGPLAAQFTEVAPYAMHELPDLDLTVKNVIAVKPERTFWDKVVILHGLRQWHDRRAELRHGGQRVSRHYYDLHQLLKSPLAAAWRNDQALAIDCARHARLFFGSADLGLDIAVAGRFTLTPSPAMRDALERDYRAMAGMVFGEIPGLDVVLDTVRDFEQIVNEEGAAAPCPKMRCE